MIFLFPGLVSVMQEGKLGQLHDMDKNPVLDVDFPSGKLRMRGTHVHTKQKFMTLLPRGKKMNVSPPSSSSSLCAISLAVTRRGGGGRLWMCWTTWWSSASASGSATPTKTPPRCCPAPLPPCLR